MMKTREPYSFQYHGECLGGLVPAGITLLAAPGEAIEPFSIVSVLLRNLDGPWASFVNALSSEGFAGIVKVYLGRYGAADGEVHVFGQLNPPTIALIPAGAVEAIDGVVGGDGLPEMIAATDRAALALLQPFAIGVVDTKKEAA